jgi:sugar lactone lactonase YvrE
VKKVAPPFTGPTYGKITNVNHKFGQPTGVAVDSHDNLYVADYGGSYPKDAVYKIATNGKISTVGHGIYTPWGVAVDAKGNVYVADTGNSAVKEVTPVGTVLTIGSGFERPFAVAVDPKGNVYVADTNGSIKKVSPPFNGPTNGKIKTLVGSGASAYGVAVDKLGDVFFIGGPALKEITPKGKVSVIAPYAYYGISVDSKFNVYFRATYGGNQSITKLTPYPAARQ